MNHRIIKIFWKIPFGGLWQGTPGSHETAESGKRILNLQKTCRKPAENLRDAGCFPLTRGKALR